MEPNSADQSDSITLAMTGASGACYGIRLLRWLLENGHRVHLLMSQPAQMVIHTETEMRLPSKSKAMQTSFEEMFQVPAGRLQVHSMENWMAPIASGSGCSRAMVVCPCTVGTLANIANGASRNLMERAADVILKEQRKLILVVRETPFSTIHLRNMLTLSQMGAVIMPANPGFYQGAETINDLVDFIVARILDHLHIRHGLVPPWGSDTPA